MERGEKAEKAGDPVTEVVLCTMWGQAQQAGTQVKALCLQAVSSAPLNAPAQHKPIEEVRK